MLALLGCHAKDRDQAAQYQAAATGSAQCRRCHEAFYKKWSTGRHGLAMQPFTPAFAKAQLTAQAQPLKIGGASYQVVTSGGATYVEARAATGVHRYPIRQVLGGKNVYYFLTLMDRGRLQTLPLAYDVHKKEWYDMAASGVRMHGGGPGEEALPWTDALFTFNSACYSCHVSQLQPNYDLATDTYHTKWREPGLDCETCHGDGAAHVALFRKDPSKDITDLRILRITRFTAGQRTEMCAPCHAKMRPISAAYQVGQRFFDHYDLVTLEDPDYYPDGRDLGENYTYTSWLMSRCRKDAKLDCIVCHTSSGRYKFASGNPNAACSGCHSEQSAHLEEHSHHSAGGAAGKCVACHMPQTRFANMNRTDHSMLPPTPAATTRFGSPNACNQCHTDRSADWADGQVRKWHAKDYQRPLLERATLIEAARKRNWARLPAMLAYLQDPAGDTVFQASLTRLLSGCNDPRRLAVIRRLLQHPDPLIRTAAATALEGDPAKESRAALLAATRDEYRLVRIRAAVSLAGVDRENLSAADGESLRSATDELLSSVRARPDDFARHAMLGTFCLQRGDVPQAVREMETAVRLRPDSVPTLVNASLAYSAAGRPADAERALRQALRLAPDNAAANFNLGLLLFELQRPREGESALLRAWKADDSIAPVAFNLCVLQSAANERGALDYCRAALRLSPRNERYAYTLAYYLAVGGSEADSIQVLESFRAREKTGATALMFLADLYLKSRNPEKARTIWLQALEAKDLTVGMRRELLSRLSALNEASDSVKK